MKLKPEEVRRRRELWTQRRQKLAELNARHQKMFAAFKASEFSKSSYQHGSATIERFVEGSMIMREARGPTEESVEDAFEHFLRNHPYNADYYMLPHPKHPVNTFCSNVRPATCGRGSWVWVKRWTHWSEYI